MKLEQASKVKSWMPTRPLTGEGRADREETDTHLFGPLTEGVERAIVYTKPRCEELGRGRLSFQAEAARPADDWNVKVVPFHQRLKCRENLLVSEIPVAPKNTRASECESSIILIYRRKAAPLNAKP